MRLFWSSKHICAVMAGLLLGAHFAVGAIRSPGEAVAAARFWMSEHPLMKSAGRELGALQIFPEDTAYRLHVFRLEPSGYLVLNSDDRLPLLVAFSADSRLSLEDLPENAFRAFLKEVAEAGAERINQLEAGGGMMAAMDFGPLAAEYPAGDFVVGPLLSSSWNQNNPYNLKAPTDPSGTPGSYYDGRVPIGCVPLAFSQLLYFHRWPLNGSGSSTYTDSIGSITGSHTADYSDSYDWDNMLDAHSPADSQPEREAIGELAYELAVAVAADFDADGTSSSPDTMRSRLHRFFSYEPSTYHSSYAALQEALDTDLLAGYPAILSIPGHAVVADGLLRAGADYQYHINYGWGGTNNGWFAHDSIPNGPISAGVTSLRPLHTPVPKQSSVQINAGEDCDLLWTLPKRRNSEVDHLRILREATHANPWTHNAAMIDAPASSGWSVIPGGYSGAGWFAGPSGTALMDLVPRFVPDAGTRLEFWLKYRLGSNAFCVSVSADGGATFTELQRWENNYPLSWARVSLPLGAYAGHSVIVRLELVNGSFYPDGGVWVDELTVTGGSRKVWETLVENPQMQILQFSKTSTIWEDGNAFDLFHITSTSPYKDWAIANVAGVGDVFYKQGGGYSNVKYHLTSQSPLAVAHSGQRLALRMKNELAADLFRVLASPDGATFTVIAEVAGSSDWRSHTVDLSAYSGTSIYLRLEYVVGSYFPGGGVWIDSISVEEVTNPQYEFQPLHQTTLAGLAAGTHTLAGQVVRMDGALTPVGPPLTLMVNASVQYRVEFVPGTHGVAAGGGTLVQMVSPGASAVLPTIDESPGWLLTGWSGSHENVQSDLTLQAVYHELLAAHGTPHWWLIDNGLASPDATSLQLNAAEMSDPSGKGNNAAFDYIAGTNPNSASDRLKFTDINVGQTGIALKWTGSLDRWYQILHSTNLAPGSWTPVATTQCTVDGQELSAMVPLTNPSSFFRISVSRDQH